MSNRYDEYEDDEQEIPSRTSSSNAIKRGWGAADRVQEASSPYAQRFKVTEDTQVIKFLEDEPYASFRTHWIDGRQGQKSFVCLHDDPNGCPLCDAGNRPSTKFAFNIAVLSNEEEALVKSFEVGVLSLIHI